MYVCVSAVDVRVDPKQWYNGPAIIAARRLALIKKQ